MHKKIIIIPAVLLTAFLLVCSDTGGVKNRQDETADYPADNPPSDDPLPEIRLESLTISAGRLTPEFKPDKYDYEADITPDISEITVTAQPPRDCYAEINSIPVTHDNCTVSLPITRRITEISIPTGDNSHAGEIYNIKVTRLEEKIIENSSFELFDDGKHPSGWELPGAGEFTSTGDFFNSGYYSASFTTLTSSISGREIISSPVEIDPENNINLSAWFYLPHIENSLMERIYISLKIYYFTDADCMYPASTAYATMTKTTIKEQGTWEKINYMRAADDIPTETGFIRIGIRICYNSAGGGTKYDKIYFDNISLRQ